MGLEEEVALMCLDLFGHLKFSQKIIGPKLWKQYEIFVAYNEWTLICLLFSLINIIIYNMEGVNNHKSSQNTILCKAFWHEKIK